MKRTQNNSEHGGAIVLFALSIVVVFLVMGLAIDLGNAYVTRARLSKAVDAAAIAGAKNAGASADQIEELSMKIAEANFQTAKGVDYQFQITTPATDTTRVTLTGATESNVYFSKLLGKSAIDVATVAEATRFPLDMSLVLDISYSLERNNAFDDMQEASSNFVEYFNDTIDQFGLVSYSTWAEERMALKKNFKAEGQGIIAGLVNYNHTNMEEGLRIAKAQIDAAPQREQAFKVVVLFTDGRPTAFRHNFTMDNQDDGCGDKKPKTYDGIVAANSSGDAYHGLFHATTGYRVKAFNTSCAVSSWGGKKSIGTTPKPTKLPGNYAVNGENIRGHGVYWTEEIADDIRDAGYTIFAIGLGDPNSSFEGDQPDLDLLTRVTNMGGISDAGQPQGEMLFSPSPSELDQTFALLADRIITRLTR